MSDWGIVSIIVLCILIGFTVQIFLCFATFYAGNRSTNDATDIDFTKQRWNGGSAWREGGGTLHAYSFKPDHIENK